MQVSFAPWAEQLLSQEGFHTIQFESLKKGEKRESGGMSVRALSRALLAQMA